MQARSGDESIALPKRSPSGALLLSLAGTAVLLTAVGLATHARERAALAQRARIQLLWPNALALSTDDRAFIEELATHCGLAAQPLIETEVRLCLEAAAADPSLTFPATPEPAVRLQALLVTDRSFAITSRRGAIPADAKRGPVALGVSR